jgi:hypothetical protein
MMPRPKKKKLGKSLGLDQLTNPMMNPWMVNPMLWRQMGGTSAELNGAGAALTRVPKQYTMIVSVGSGLTL